LKKEFIKTYGEKISTQIRMDDLLFSPNGQFLAISLMGIYGGDPEQVWILDLKSKKCRLVTELVSEKIGISLYHIGWISERILKVYFERVYIPNQSLNENKVFLSSIDQTTESDEKWESRKFDTYDDSSKSKYYKIEFPSKGNKLELVNIQNGEKQYFNLKKVGIDKNQIEKFAWTSDGKQFAFTNNFGHGEEELFLGITSPHFRIIKLNDDSGNKCWDISPYSSEIVYSVNRDSCLIIYNAAKQEIIKKIKTGVWPYKVSWGNDKKIVFISYKIGIKNPYIFDSQSLRLYLVTLE
jgi:WD40 repeat protein